MEAAELELPYLAMDQKGFAEDPFPHFAAARAAHPWLGTSPYGYVILDYFAMRELMRMEENFRMPHGHIVEMMGATGTPWNARISFAAALSMPSAEPSTPAPT